ncbi:MAG: hypothetical protein GX561_00500 [Lentisphaerae bacterium]|jgi:hypothetical protein|nr:hypothetical protein [Lentisphaerota bacterium]
MKGRIRRIFLTRAWKNLSKRLEKNILSFEYETDDFLLWLRGGFADRQQFLSRFGDGRRIMEHP